MLAQDTLKNYIGGRWEPALASDSQPVVNPATGDVIAAAPLSSGADVEKAVRAASEALVKWRRTPPVERVCTVTLGAGQVADVGFSVP
jgi:malonate-semialdehyde dehydrogenase (acetylating)/methylmalonate-semialdehyde dehydrogenase